MGSFFTAWFYGFGGLRLGLNWLVWDYWFNGLGFNWHNWEWFGFIWIWENRWDNNWRKGWLINFRERWWLYNGFLRNNRCWGSGFRFSGYHGFRFSGYHGFRRGNLLFWSWWGWFFPTFTFTTFFFFIFCNFFFNVGHAFSWDFIFGRWEDRDDRRKRLWNWFWLRFRDWLWLRNWLWNWLRNWFRLGFRDWLWLWNWFRNWFWLRFRDRCWGSRGSGCWYKGFRFSRYNGGNWLFWSWWGWFPTFTFTTFLF